MFEKKNKKKTGKEEEKKDLPAQAGDKKELEDKDLDSNNLKLLQEVLENIQAEIKKALQLIKSSQLDDLSLRDYLSYSDIEKSFSAGSERVIEGVFNGEAMVGPDGKEYTIPANYASKSKLVEGDILKLTIAKNGSFIYKQIGPIQREQLITTLVKNDATGEYIASADDGRKWKLLTASVTYFHGQPGDEIVILIPKTGKSSWAAVENIIKKAV